MTQLAFATQLGVCHRSLTRYLSGEPVPPITLRAIDGIILLLDLQDVINSTKPGHTVLIGKLMAVHPSLTRAEPAKRPKKPAKPKRAEKQAKVKLPGRKGRGIGMPRVYPGEPDGPQDRINRIIGGLRPADQRAGAINEARVRAALASYGVDQPDPPGDELPPSKPPIITRLL